MARLDATLPETEQLLKRQWNSAKASTRPVKRFLFRFHQQHWHEHSKESDLHAVVPQHRGSSSPVPQSRDHVRPISFFKRSLRLKLVLGAILIEVVMLSLLIGNAGP